MNRKKRAVLKPKKLRQSHLWQEIVASFCPYCRKENIDYDATEGTVILCHYCKRRYELGDQR